ncbi:MAG: DUF151 domain-containing protein [Acidilobaceae archaeon]
MERGKEDRLIKVSDVVVSWKQIQDPYTGYTDYVLGLDLILEDKRVFSMVNIPSDVAEAIRVMKGEAQAPRRQSFFVLALFHESLKEALSQHIEDVVIDELDRATGLYSASVRFTENGAVLTIKMIPSHAVFLALLSNKPIYVLEKLVEDSYVEP